MSLDVVKPAREFKIKSNKSGYDILDVIALKILSYIFRIFCRFYKVVALDSATDFGAGRGIEIDCYEEHYGKGYE